MCRRFSYLPFELPPRFAICWCMHSAAAPALGLCGGALVSAEPRTCLSLLISVHSRARFALAEFSKIASATSIGFAIMGFIGFFVKLIFIPINNIIVGRG